MTSLKIALDWTPNINHIGILVAKDLGFYAQRGLNLTWYSPEADNYSVTPGKKLDLGEVDMAIAPFETIISLNNKEKALDAFGIFAILQEDLSSIACLASSGIESPKDLDGKIYASYKARYEDLIVSQMIINAGGQGRPSLIYPEKLGIWQTLLSGQADATWIFDHWEGIEAPSKGVKLTCFRLQDFGIPYGYSPVIVTKKHVFESQKGVYLDFIEATKQGYLHGLENTKEVLDVLYSHLTAYDRANVDIEKSLRFTQPYFGDSLNCGLMQSTKVNRFLRWLVDHELEDSKILSQDLCLL